MGQGVGSLHTFERPKHGPILEDLQVGGQLPTSVHTSIRSTSGSLSPPFSLLRVWAQPLVPRI